jgi:hypothetical protein
MVWCKQACFKKNVAFAISNALLDESCRLRLLATKQAEELTPTYPSKESKFFLFLWSDPGNPFQDLDYIAKLQE